MKNYGDRGGCYPPRPTASTDSTLRDLGVHNTNLFYHSFKIVPSKSIVETSLPASMLSLSSTVYV